MKHFEELDLLVKDRRPGHIAVAAAHDDHVLQSVHAVCSLGYANATLVGDKEAIFEQADRLGVDLSGMKIIKELDPQACAAMAVNLVNNGEADVLMKGNLQTADLLKAVLAKEQGLRTNQLLSHVGLYELPSYHKLLMVTDAGINIQPDLQQKAQIIRNAVGMACRLGIDVPKVAVLAAVELVNPSMQATLDAASLSLMAKRGQIRDCLIDGPLAMDNAIDRQAARQKHITSDVAGDADILLAPDIESGNILVKSLVFLAQARSCGIITGARVPLVVTSRAESSEAKYYAILLALALLDHRQ